MNTQALKKKFLGFGGDPRFLDYLKKESWMPKKWPVVGDWINRDWEKEAQKVAGNELLEMSPSSQDKKAILAHGRFLNEAKAKFHGIKKGRPFQTPEFYFWLGALVPYTELMASEVKETWISQWMDGIIGGDIFLEKPLNYCRALRQREEKIPVQVMQALFYGAEAYLRWLKEKRAQGKMTEEEINLVQWGNYIASAIKHYPYLKFFFKTFTLDKIPEIIIPRKDWPKLKSPKYRAKIRRLVKSQLSAAGSR